MIMKRIKDIFIILLITSCPIFCQDSFLFPETEEELFEITSPLDTLRWEPCDSTEFYAALDSSIVDDSILTETRGEDHGHWEWREMYIWCGGYVYLRHWHRDWTPQEHTTYRRAIWRG